MGKIQDFIDILAKSNSIAIFSHTNPDADAITSSLAFKQWLKDNYEGKTADIYIDGDISPLYLPFAENLISSPSNVDASKYDLGIVLDCNSLNRIGNCKAIFDKIPNKVNIDHHEGNENFATVNLTYTRASSTGEFLYILFSKLNTTISDETAKNLYAGIITDTNCFTSSNMTAKTHSIVAELMQKEFDADAIRDYFFKNNSKSKTMILQHALRSLKFFENDRISSMKISHADLVKSEAVFEDTLGIADQGISISGVEIAILVIEKEPNSFYISLRSKNELIDVSKIAQKFNGGGHLNAAAFQYIGELKNISSDVLEACKEELKYLPEVIPTDMPF